MEQAKTWHVLVVDDDGGRRAIALDAVTFTLGRDPSNSIVLDSTSISRQHAILIRVPNTEGNLIYRVLDGNSEGKPSLNGLAVNGRKVMAQDLKDGDIILFGGKVKAQYCVRSLTDEQYNQYIESVSYRSVKSEVSDPRVTVAEVLDAAQARKTPQRPIKVVSRHETHPPEVEEPTESVIESNTSDSWISRLVGWLKSLFS